jgi:hypothetical protein
MIFGALALVVFYAWTRAHSVRRALLALEDPRTMAILRIGFGLFTIFCFLNLFPYWRMLWSDEGVFDMAYAQDRLGRGALRAWTPEEGFFGMHTGEVFLPYLFGVDVDVTFMERFEQWRLWSIGVFLWNKPSLHYFYGSPSFVVSYMLVFFAVLMLFTVGLWTRVMAVLAWLMMSGVYNRNALYWEGTDTVYRTFWFILLWAQTDRAWSVDNWLRCRRLRAKGMLDEDEPPKSGLSDAIVYYGLGAIFLVLGIGAVVLEIPVVWTGGFAAAASFVVLGVLAQRKGAPKPPAEDAPDSAKEPVYRRIPAWPRYLFMLQLSAIYITTRRGQDRKRVERGGRPLLRAQHGSLLPLRVLHAVGQLRVRAEPLPRELVGDPLLGAALPAGAAGRRAQVQPRESRRALVQEADGAVARGCCRGRRCSGRTCSSTASSSSPPRFVRRWSTTRCRTPPTRRS